MCALDRHLADLVLNGHRLARLENEAPRTDKDLVLQDLELGMARLELDVRNWVHAHAHARSLDQRNIQCLPPMRGLLTDVTKVSRCRTRIPPQDLAGRARHVHYTRVPVADQPPRRRVLDQAVDLQARLAAVCIGLDVVGAVDPGPLQ